MVGGVRERLRQDRIDSVILVSLPSLKKQAEKPHQWGLKLDTPITILGFIFQCSVVYAAMLVNTSKKNPNNPKPHRF